MAVAVAADLVALLKDPVSQFGVLLHPVAAEEEGGPDIPVPQALEEGPGEPARGAVVEGQGHIFGPLRRARRQGQQTQAQEDDKKSAHGAHFLWISFDEAEKIGYDIR